MSFRASIHSLFSNAPALAMAASFLGSSFIALSPLFVRFSEVGSTATAFYRFFFALPLAWTLMIFDNLQSEKHRTPRSVREYILLMLAGLFLGMDITFWHLAMIKTSLINAILLNNMTPVLVAGAAWIFFKEKLTLSMALGIILALVGSFLLVKGNAIQGSAHLEGDFYALVSAVFYAAYMICVKELRRSFSAPTILFWVTVAGMYVLGINAHLMHEVVVPLTLKGWGILILLAIVVHILGSGLLSYSMGHLSVTFSSLTTLIGPFIAALLGWLVFHEVLSLQQALGGVIVTGGIILSRVQGRKKE